MNYLLLLTILVTSELGHAATDHSRLYQRATKPKANNGGGNSPVRSPTSEISAAPSRSMFSEGSMSRISFESGNSAKTAALRYAHKKMRQERERQAQQPQPGRQQQPGSQQQQGPQSQQRPSRARQRPTEPRPLPEIVVIKPPEVPHARAKVIATGAADLTRADPVANWRTTTGADTRKYAQKIKHKDMAMAGGIGLTEDSHVQADVEGRTVTTAIDTRRGGTAKVNMGVDGVPIEGHIGPGSQVQLFESRARPGERTMLSVALKGQGNVRAQGNNN